MNLLGYIHLAKILYQHKKISWIKLAKTSSATCCLKLEQTTSTKLSTLEY